MTLIWSNAPHPPASSHLTLFLRYVFNADDVSLASQPPNWLFLGYFSYKGEKERLDANVSVSESRIFYDYTDLQKYLNISYIKWT